MIIYNKCLLLDDFDAMTNEDYKLSTLVVTFFIAFFQIPVSVILDIYTLQITKQLGPDFLPLPDRPLTCFQVEKPIVYIPVCNGVHWILLKFSSKSGILEEMNSLISCKMDTAVNGIAKCLANYPKDSICIGCF